MWKLCKGKKEKNKHFSLLALLYITYIYVLERTSLILGTSARSYFLLRILSGFFKLHDESFWCHKKEGLEMSWLKNLCQAQDGERVNTHAQIKNRRKRGKAEKTTRISEQRECHSLSAKVLRKILPSPQQIN